MTNGFVHRFTCWTSTIHMIVAIAKEAMPAQNSTYELVQIPLLIGKDQFHINPTIIPSAPAANSPLRRSESGRLLLSHSPASVPSMAVAIAGIVDIKPSGSHVTPPTQM